MYINQQGKMPINGTWQYLSVRAERKNAPLLLYLHGGPGDAALPLVLQYNKELETRFTVVVWEQRGAGKSYDAYDGGALTLNMFLEDLKVLVETLLACFKQESLYLVGHSWGSVLGLQFTHSHPELVRAYIGCGQVVNMKKSCRAAYEYAAAHANRGALKRLEKIDCSYTADGWLNDLLFVTKQVVKHQGSLYGRSNYNDLIKPFLFSKHYTLFDLYRRQKGSLRSIQALWQELMQVDFEGVTQYQSPVLFVEGRYDSHVSSALAKEYFDTIETEKQFFWFEKSCHFPQWSENDRFNKLLIGLLE